MPAIVAPCVLTTNRALHTNQAAQARDATRCKCSSTTPRDSERANYPPCVMGPVAQTIFDFLSDFALDPIRQKSCIAVSTYGVNGRSHKSFEFNALHNRRHNNNKIVRRMRENKNSRGYYVASSGRVGSCQRARPRSASRRSCPSLFGRTCHPKRSTIAKGNIAKNETITANNTKQTKHARMRRTAT